MFAHIAYSKAFPLRRLWSHSLSRIHRPGPMLSKVVGFFIGVCFQDTRHIIFTELTTGVFEAPVIASVSNLGIDVSEAPVTVGVLVLQ